MAATTLIGAPRVFKTEQAFLWAFGIGFVIILMAKWLSQGHPIFGGIVASVLGIIIMLLYKSGQEQIRPQHEHPRLGDEVYYIGLLYTLTSLCAALVSLFLFHTAEQTLAKRTDEMIGSFGIALLTTMAGIVIRMTLQRHGPASGDDHQGAEIEGVTVDLERYAHELRRQLQNSTNAFEAHANKAILQARTTHAHMDELVQAFHDGLEAKSKAGLEHLDASYMSLVQRAEETAQRTEEQSEAIRAALGSFEGSVKSLEQSVEQIRVGSSATAGHLEAIGTQAQAGAIAVSESSRTAAEGLNALAEATAGKQLEEALQPIMRQIRYLAEITSSEFEGRRQLKEAIQEIAEMAATAKRYTQNLKDTEGEVQRINAGLHSVQKALEEDGVRLAGLFKQVILALEEARSRPWWWRKN